MAFADPEKDRDTYFSLWALTEEGAQSPAKVRATIETASAMIRRAGGTCHLYVAIGGPWEMIGVAKGVDDERIMEIQHAIRALGTVQTTFVKTKEFSLQQFQAFAENVTGLAALKG
jgi:uncharacterized protein with GYD domain